MIYVGLAVARFRQVFLLPFLERYERDRTHAYILDLSETGEICDEIAAMLLPEELREDLHVARSTAKDAEAAECLMRLTIECDPGVKPNEVVFDLDPRTFPKLAWTCHAISSKWFFGSGPMQEEKSGESIPTIVDLRRLDHYLTYRRFPHRPEALLLGKLELLEKLVHTIFSFSHQSLSFSLLAETPSRTDRLWPWAASPDLVVSDYETFERLSDWKGWIRTTWILAADDARHASKLLAQRVRDPKKRRLLPELILACTASQPERATTVWLTRSLKRFAHALPSAEFYQPRREVENELNERWRKGEPCVVALVGLGGMGKTSLVQQFLQNCPLTRELEEIEDVKLPASDAVFAWNFYARPSADLFLLSLANYLTGRETASASGEESLQSIREGLWERNMRRVLFVLDGLEIIQEETEDSSDEAKLQSAPVAQLLREIALGDLPVFAIATSRMAPSDLGPYHGRGYFPLNIRKLEPQLAIALLRHCGVRGEDEVLVQLAESFGCHALTIYHLGKLLGEFYQGDPKAAGNLPPVVRILHETGVTETDNTNRQLIRLLARYEEMLPEQELAILQRLAMFYLPLTVPLFEQIFLHEDDDLAGTLAALPRNDLQACFNNLHERRLLTVFTDTGEAPQYMVHPTLSDYFVSGLGEYGDDFEDLPPLYTLPDPLNFGGRTTSGYVRTRGLFRTRQARTGPQGYLSNFAVKPATLDFIERIIFRTIIAGRTEEARFLFLWRLGGSRHLLEIDEGERAERIESWFEPRLLS